MFLRQEGEKIVSLFLQIKKKPISRFDYVDLLVVFSTVKVILSHENRLEITRAGKT